MLELNAPPYQPAVLEPRWQRAWQEHKVFEVPDRPARPKWFVMELPPFATGQLHMGHARNYVLADANARFRRMLGHDVLYTSGFDTFGLPTELAARAAGCAPQELASRCSEAMGAQFVRLGLGHDRRRITEYHVPAYYRWVQWVFVKLFEAGHCFRREAPAQWCPQCEIALAASLVEDGCCWRCRSAVQERMLPQWFVRESAFADAMLEGLDRLPGWPDTVKKIHRDWIGRRSPEDDEAGCGVHYRLQDWNIARDRYWGPPVPIVHCTHCGPVAVPEAQLPVLLPQDVDLAQPGNPLQAHRAFRAVACPRCGAPAERDAETLEAYSSPWWYHWLCRSLDAEGSFDREDARTWLPVDLMVGGSDQIRSCFFHVRMIARALRSMDVAEIEEPVDTLLALGMVKQDNRKMSKSAGNAVDLDATIARYGADALRLAILGAAAPERDFNWSEALVRRQHAHLNAVWAFMHRLAGTARQLQVRIGTLPDADGRSALGQRMQTWLASADRRLGANLRRNDSHLAVKNTEFLFERLQAFDAAMRKPGDPQPRDVAVLADAARRFVLYLAPLAPHIAEELWQLLGGTGLVAAAAWPGDAAGEADTEDAMEATA
ncbi:MAG: class I tRNA ligase family protein [Pseudomonadota bacterium]